jgi:hypothetical protein
MPFKSEEIPVTRTEYAYVCDKCGTKRTALTSTDPLPTGWFATPQSIGLTIFICHPCLRVIVRKALGLDVVNPPASEG